MLEEFTGTSPCERQRLTGFDGSLQCLAYDLREERILVTGHAARKEFVAASIMHNRFFTADNEHIYTGSANTSIMERTAIMPMLLGFFTPNDCIHLCTKIQTIVGKRG